MVDSNAPQEGRQEGRSDTVAFGVRLLASSAFKDLFRAGMALVEETAAYLDGQGRDDARQLSRMGALAYATESMRLTTRLMQIASWLLLQRAVSEGEMSVDQARLEKNKVRLASAREPDAETAAELPPRLVDLIRQSLRLEARIRRLDESIDAEPVPERANDNPVGLQVGRLKAAFERRL